MDININELVKFFNKLLEKSELNGFGIFEVNNDYYWNIPNEVSFDFSNTTPQITVGSLLDDYTSLQQMLAEDLCTPLDYERLAHLLLALSYEIYSSDRPFIC